MVNDGSPDDSLEVALGLHRRNKCVRVIDLSRNFGHHKAMMTGLSHAMGDLVFLIDSDLEEEPELLAIFYQHFQESKDTDVVYGVQEMRKGNFFERWSGSLFFKLFNMLSSYPLPTNLLTVRLMTRRYVTSLVSHREHTIVISGLWKLTGFKQVPLTVKKSSKGISTYNFGRKVILFVNAVTSFSDRPLVFIFYLGSIILLFSIASALHLIIQRVFFGVFLSGWPSLIVSVWLLGGMMIFCLGIIGIYLSRVFIETKQRPYTIIRARYEHDAVE